MTTVINLKLPVTWSTTESNNPNFPISADQLNDFMEVLGTMDWGGVNWIGIGTINGITPGAGGGGINMFTTGLFREEFSWTDFDGFFDADYIAIENGELVSGSGDGHYGFAELATDGTIAGDAGEIFGDIGFLVDLQGPNGGDVTFYQIVTVADLADAMAICSIQTTIAGDGITNQAGFFSALSTASGIGFIYDPATSANWQIWSLNQGGFLTINTTTVAVVNNARQSLKVVYTKSNTTAEFFINKVSVGTINTNIPQAGQEMGMYSGIYQKTAGQEALFIDTWVCEAERVAGL